MSYAALNAARVYEACQRALAARQQANMDIGQGNADFVRLRRVADLANHVSRVEGGAAVIFITVDDYALFNGHWSPGKQAIP